MKTQIKALKVKIKSLAEEARIIRREERSALGRPVYADKTADPPVVVKVVGRDEELYKSLRDHRRKDVRAEARHALLAYGFLRGRDYRQVEAGKAKKCHRSLPADWKRVAALVAKFEGPPQNVTSKFRVPELVALLNAWADGSPSPHKRLPKAEAQA